MALTIVPQATVSANAAMNEQRITSTSDWTAPTGVNKVWIIAIGGGGGGGCNQTTGQMVLGGRSGAVKQQQVTVTPGTSYTVTIGAGGAGRSTGNGPGSAGTDTVFNTVTAIGGIGVSNGSTPSTNSNYWALPLGQFGGVEGNVPTGDGGSASENTGSGGSANAYGTGGNGGSGVVIVRWLA
jgi:hypothetical protein